MATFNFTAPNGTTYRVAGDNREGALQALKKMLGGQPAPAAPQAITPPSSEEGESYDPNELPPPRNNVVPVKPFGTLIGTDPTFGDHLYAAAKNIGLPASQMRKDLESADAVVRGVADTGTLGMADEISAWLGSKTGIGGKAGDLAGNLNAQRFRDERDTQEHGGARTLGKLGGGLLLGSGLVRAGLSPSAAAVNAGWSLPKVALTSGAEGAVLGGVHGFGSGEGIDDRLDKALWEGLGGAAVGLASPFVIAGAQRVVSPFAASAERQAAAQALRNEGVRVTAGQLTGNKRLRFAEAELGGAKAARMMDDQADAFTSAVLKRAGINANRATPEVLDEASKTVAQRFDDLVENNNLVPDAEMIGNLQNVFKKYGDITAESARVPIVSNLKNDILKASRSGPISSETYRDFAARSADTGRRTSNADLKNALYGIRELLDDAMERSMPAAQIRAWRNVRDQRKNLLAIEQSAARAGEAAEEGIISPANIRNALVNQGRRADESGKADFADLARAGSMLLSPLPSSGATERAVARGLINAQTILGAVFGAASGGGVQGTLAGTIIGAAAPRILGALMMSRPGQALLGNQVGRSLSPQTRALFGTVLNTQGPELSGRAQSYYKALTGK